MKYAAVLMLCLTSLVWGSGVRLSAEAASGIPAARGMNVRLVAGAAVPAGATHLFGAWYNLPHVAQDKAVSMLGSAADVVEPDFVVSLPDPVVSAQDDPLVAQQYQLALVHAQEAWGTTRGAGVVIAVIDTGIDCGHEDLAAHCRAGYDFTDTGSTADDNGHGTHVAGIAAALGGNGQGGSGVAPDAALLPVKVLGANGSGQLSAVASGIVWAAQNGARVENLSLGCRCDSQLIADAVSDARSLGAVVIAAAGNDSTNIPATPAQYAVGVGAIDAASQRAGFSNYGGNARVAAPGVNILSTCRGNQYCSMSGTSMASPVAAGAAALLVAACPACSAPQIETALVDGADPIVTDKPVGGRLNVARSLTMLGIQPSPTASPTPGSSPPSATPMPGDYDDQLVALINAQRAVAGLPAYRNDSRLAAASANHNYTMAQNNCFSHVCPGEADPFQRMRNAGYPLVNGGENIGLGYVTPQDMVDGWMASDGHRAAILARGWTDVGCAYLRTGQPWDTYWTCDFASGAGGGLPQPSATPRPTATPPLAQPTPWGAGHKMVIVAEAGDKALWDELYTRYCYPPRSSVSCRWPRLGETITP